MWPWSCEMRQGSVWVDLVFLISVTGSHPRRALGAHSPQQGNQEACCREHQEPSSEPTAEAPGRDAQEACGRPGGGGLRQPHVCYCQRVTSPALHPFCLTAIKTKPSTGRYQTDEWWPEATCSLEGVCSTPSYLGQREKHEGKGKILNDKAMKAGYNEGHVFFFCWKKQIVL